MKKRVILGVVAGVLALTSIGFGKKENIEVNVLGTTDLHGIVSKDLEKYVNEQRKKDENLILVDSGDFFDMQTPEMNSWFKKNSVIVEENGFPILRFKDGEIEGVAPIVTNMGKLKYDAVILGNHEFVSNNKSRLDTLINDFKDNNMEILSANTYKSNNENYTKPYIIKNINTKYGDLKIGILGLTIKEVGESKEWDGEKLVPTKSRELKDQDGYEGKLYMNDLVEDAKKWVPKMKKDGADIIISVVHSGEEPKKPKNPGNKIKELARETSDIDVIFAGHTHKTIDENKYTNKDGKEVIVTQGGKHSEAIAHSKLQLEKVKDGWKVIEKSSEVISFK
ncbi:MULTISPECIES: metallophosphoesterase [Romboutsia]|uniref:Ser/Thr phosphatase protein n=1 Tax=Romboutsia hominis TaxID=1507512 RepID=A0A2P2BUJ0_9FIRM|nr:MULTISPECIES: metallophosphoesterase [Romboutsia]MDB8794550.1 metallophosphoesterase [Romboutsia sp. 1001216sp1]MDB8796120.1 metallophosphoesterase [Romboutsia sp. 1001216sp1]MDB8798113.1 metallophosphoesterase [Romboutsia sp. 1001216sp1]CEI72654.1 Ser/Thr phosphatase protein [Romboutsia hominis]